MESESLGNATTEHHGLGGINKSHLFLEVREAGKSKTTVAAESVSGERPFPGSRQASLLSPCPHREAGARELPAVYFRRAQGLLGRAHLLTETPPRAPASGHHHMGIRISYANFGETQPIEREKWEKTLEN